LVAAQELKVIAITDPASRRNNSFFILVFYKFKKGELKLVFKGGLEDGCSEESTKILCHDYIS